MDLRKFGGVPVPLMGAFSDPNDPANVAYNFGVKEEPEAVTTLIRAKAPLYAQFPNMQGRWDGKASVNHWQAVLKNYNGDWSKAEELIQYQPRGTCGGRAGSFTGDMVQHILIGTGKRAKFMRTSHAAVYYFARKLYNMIGNGNWQDESDDGVASGSVPEALAKMGYANRDEAHDSGWYGPGSDDLACQLAAGMQADLARKLEEAAKDNLITAWAPVTSAQEMADGIAAGGVGIISDSRGYSMTRDSNGYCRPQGTWYHYHVRAGVLGTDNYPRKGFAYNQSWSKNTPSGPRLKDYPGNCFGVDWDVDDANCRNGRAAVVFGFALWDLERQNYDIPWTV
jgi:hypothetical protein